MSGPSILLASGCYFDLLEPEKSAFTIEDIAHGLSNTCRFAGQSREFYSVAQHSVYVSCVVPSEHALAGLLHDASEAFIHDLTKPLKNLLPEYRVIEARIEAVIAERFGFLCPLPDAVKSADLRMLATEQIQLMNNRDLWTSTRGVEPYEIDLSSWKPGKACQRFLNRFAELATSQGSFGDEPKGA